MELKNKKIAFLGDSITQGCNASTPDNFYWNVVARETGAISYGYGIGGTRIARSANRRQIPFMTDTFSPV